MKVVTTHGRVKDAPTKSKTDCGVDYVVRAWGAAVLRPYMIEVGGDIEARRNGVAG